MAMKCDCCEYFGQEPTGEIELCKLCGKYFCQGCKYSRKRMEYFVKYWTRGRLPELERVIRGESELPKHLRKNSDG